MKKQCIIVSNILFIRLDNAHWDKIDNPIYLQGSVSGSFTLNNMITYDDIKHKWKDKMIEFDSLLDIKENWNK